MKKVMLFALAALIALLPLISGCDLFGKSAEEKAYERELEAIKAQIEANQKAQAEYNEYLQEAMNDYLEDYQEYSNAQFEQQYQQALQQLEELEQQQESSQ